MAVDPPAADGGQIACGVVRGVDRRRTSVSSPTIQTLLSTSQVPPSRLNVPDVAVDARPTRLRAVTGRHNTTTERSTSPRCIFAKASSMSPSPIGLGDERVEVEPALPVEVDEHREVARSAGSRRTRLDFSEPPRPKTSMQRQVELHVRGRHADQHDACRPDRGRRRPARTSPGGRPPRSTTSAPLPPVSLPDRLDRVGVSGS